MGKKREKERREIRGRGDDLKYLVRRPVRCLISASGAGACLKAVGCVCTNSARCVKCAFHQAPTNSVCGIRKFANESYDRREDMSSKSLSTVGKWQAPHGASSVLKMALFVPSDLRQFMDTGHYFGKS